MKMGNVGARFAPSNEGVVNANNIDSNEIETCDEVCDSIWHNYNSPGPDIEFINVKEDKPVVDTHSEPKKKRSFTVTNARNHLEANRD